LIEGIELVFCEDLVEHTTNLEAWKDHKLLAQSASPEVSHEYTLMKITKDIKGKVGAPS
jgi:hypothetical protein